MLGSPVDFLLSHLYYIALSSNVNIALYYTHMFQSHNVSQSLNTTCNQEMKCLEKVSTFKFLNFSFIVEFANVKKEKYVCVLIHLLCHLAISR